MVENKERLIDATKRLLMSGTAEQDAVLSMTEVGLSEPEAKSIVQQAKGLLQINPQDGQSPAGKNPNPSAEKQESFWNSDTGKFFALEEQENIPKETLKENQAQRREDALSRENLGKKPYFKVSITEFRKITPVLVSDFDKLIDKGGMKKGDIILLSGGAGTGKTTFGMQFLYNGAKVKGEKGIYITLEESPERIKENVMESFGWDIDALEAKGLLAIIKVDPLTLSRSVEANIIREKGDLYIESEQFDSPFLSELPFKPDRLVIDSLSAISIAFSENSQGYRQYILRLFDTVEKYGSVNLVLDETVQNPTVYSRTGIEEFLADGVLVFYNIKTHNRRENALEILKMRSSAHVKRLVPYKITSNGFELYADQEVFFED